MAQPAAAPSAPRFPLLKSYPLTLQRPGSGPGEAQLGLAVGLVNNARVIVSGIAAGAFNPGEKVQARMSAGSQVLTFTTTVVEVLGGSVPLLVLTMPDKLESLNARSAERVALLVPAEVQYSRTPTAGRHATDLATMQGMVLNLSRGGCCLSTRRQLAEEQTLRLTFSLPGARAPFQLPAKVLRHLGSPRPGVFWQGIQFEGRTEHAPTLAELGQWLIQNLPMGQVN
jgi:hypothetical protein